MRTLTAYAIATAIIALAWENAAGQASVGGAFRQPGYGARVGAMGGAGAALVGDESAVYWNPAMMALMSNTTVGMSYVNLVPGTTARQSQFAYAIVLEENDQDIDRATARHVIGVLYTNVRLDINEDNNYTENLLRVAYAFTPEHFITFAGSIEGFFSRSSVDNFGAVGTTVDAAVRLNLTRYMTLGVVARDAFSRYSYSDGVDYNKDRGFTAALGYTRLRLVDLEADVWWDYGAASRFVLGAETEYIGGFLALRAGVASLRAGVGRTVLSAGLGVRAYRERIHLHYNVNLDEETAFGDTHRFTLSVTL